VWLVGLKSKLEQEQMLKGLVMAHPDGNVNRATPDKDDATATKYQSVQECEMRVLTDNEVLSVAGGPEVDVESGT
jgi:hypothetical protein